MSSFTIWNVQSVVLCESGRVPSRKSVYFGISKLILYFPYNFHVTCILLFTVYFHVPCTVHFTVYFRTVISMFFFLFYWSHSKANAVNQMILIKTLFLSKICHRSVIQTNELQRLRMNSNIKYSKFQKCYFFIWGLFWRR